MVSGCQKIKKFRGVWLGPIKICYRILVAGTPSMNSLEFDGIGVEEAARLEEMFSMEEVYLAISELNGDKAPGPNGEKFVKSLNTTFLVLVPKKGGADDLSDFRLISLVGGLYKLLAKVLANRLKKVVGKVVSSTQNAFVEGRQILNAALIANEAINSLLKGMKVSNQGGFPNRLQDKGKGCQWDPRLSFNLNKSEILPVGRVENVELLAFELDCKVGALPSTYLGLPLVAPHKSVVVWDGVEERMRKRLALWKRQFISKGGITTLIRNTLGPFVQRSWHYAVERESLWKLVISRKFGEEGGGWSSHEVREGYGVGFWKEIRKESGGGGEAPFDPSRKESSCWFGGQGGVERDEE
ncbi:hypothetical protein CK203_027605 [Vitis vinifera]|uniref:Uncharacterized protein n=1 Tax=Vitis vinifera TaxID=29760 RepID=A0A438IGZ4_VITVI|nr:hypothetical protein CK203_027605 [Vitis vinifera]